MRAGATRAERVSIAGLKRHDATGKVTQYVYFQFALQTPLRVWRSKPFTGRAAPDTLFSVLQNQAISRNLDRPLAVFVGYTTP